jgi:hypothetical protein
MKSLSKAVYQYFKNGISDYRALPAEKKRVAFTKTLMFLSGVLTVNICFAQDGSAGITEATTMVKGYFDAGCNLMYAIGAILGIVGAIKVFRKWNEGEPDTNKVAAAWFGSCIFLVVVATVIKSFFGL